MSAISKLQSCVSNIPLKNLFVHFHVAFVRRHDEVFGQADRVAEIVPSTAGSQLHQCYWISAVYYEGTAGAVGLVWREVCNSDYKSLYTHMHTVFAWLNAAL